MAQYLLDTDICIELFRHNEHVIKKIETVWRTLVAADLQS